MNLYIIRHAIAVARGTPGYEEDSQRPLTDKGRKKMKKIVEGIRQLGIRFDTILSSPYLRARDTAKIVADEYEMRDKILFTDNLIPPGDFDQLIAEINEKYRVDHLALVGHEPMLSQFISYLIAGNTSTDITLKKGGIGCLSAGQLGTEQHATLKWLLTPGILVELSE
jgi:phosphohistidine phosphatase